MRRLTRLLLGSTTLTLVLSSCTPVYVHPTKGPREFAQDSVRCQALAGQAAGFYDPYGIQRAMLVPQCLYGEGWSRLR